jgi:hypothetical protein
MTEVQQPVIFSIKKNQNPKPLHMHTVNTHTNNPYNKVFTWKLWKGLARKITYTCIITHM